jgi:hypothetical protein
MLIVADEVETLLSKVQAYEAPKVAKWVHSDER